VGQDQVRAIREGEAAAGPGEGAVGQDEIAQPADLPCDAPAKPIGRVGNRVDGESPRPLTRERVSRPARCRHM
jgi:hypothetical protein